MVNRNETGRDGVLRVGGDQYPFTNCSYTIEYETENSDFNDGLRQYTAYISVHVSGSFEWDGSVPSYKNLTMRPDGRPRDNIRMSIDLSEESIALREVKINSYARDADAGGKTTGTVEWEADVFTLSESGIDGGGQQVGPGVESPR